MENCLGALKVLIDHIDDSYVSVTDEWKRQTGGAPVNLKRTMVSCISVDSPIYNSVIEYAGMLNDQCKDIALQLALVCSCEVTTRVKTQNSIEFKIQNYKTEAHEFGKVQINRCINDLFGVRIFLKPPIDFDDIFSFIRETYGDKYRILDSSKQDYRAIHLYFKKDNYSFPWELQIWNECDSKSNLISHKKYKQEYTAWEKKNKKGGTLDD